MWPGRSCQLVPASGCASKWGTQTDSKSELERRITAQPGCIVAVFISSRDHHDPEADDVFQTVSNLTRLKQIHDARRNQTRQIFPALDLPQERKTGIGVHLRCVKMRRTGLLFKDDKAGATDVDYIMVRGRSLETGNFGRDNRKIPAFES